MRVTCFEHPLAIGRPVVVRRQAGEVTYGELVGRKAWQTRNAEGWEYSIAVPTADEIRYFLTATDRRVQPLDLRNPDHLALLMPEESP